jgi:feruloyl esterase
MSYGFSDNAISPYRSEIFYNELAALFDGDYGRYKNMYVSSWFQAWIRGPGANSFDTLTALENWVEKGYAPDGIVATNMTSGRSMPLCKYPGQATYIGGNLNRATSWACDPKS